MPVCSRDITRRVGNLFSPFSLLQRRLCKDARVVTVGQSKIDHEDCLTLGAWGQWQGGGARWGHAQEEDVRQADTCKKHGL